MDKSACFTGHRNIRHNAQELSSLLCKLLDVMIAEKDITDYYVGGAVGFDTIAAYSILKMQEKYPKVKLHLILPCSNEDQTKGWTVEQVSDFEYILGLAHSVEYISNNYYNGCMKKRNARLVELASECCICYWNTNNNRSGTGQTVRMSMKKGINVINLYEMLHI